MEEPTQGQPPPSPSDPAAPLPAQSRSPQPEGLAAPPGAPAPPAAEEPIAPGIPRLGTPVGAARRIDEPHRPHPSYVFFAIVALITVASDISSKLAAEKRLDQYPPYITVIDNHLSFILAKNRGGAWGLLQGTNEGVRRPFFLLVSAAAIAFIVTLYHRLQPRQRALKWGLPLVFGGAVGNVFDRVRYGHVIDFIDYRADWVREMNELVGRLLQGRGSATDHWPTFNVADIAICVGVGLMAIDMFTAKRGRVHPVTGKALPSLPPPPAPPLAGDAPAEAPPHVPADAPAGLAAEASPEPRTKPVE